MEHTSGTTGLPKRTPGGSRPDLVDAARERTHGAHEWTGPTQVLPTVGARSEADPPALNMRSELIALYAHLCEAEEAVRAECATHYPGMSPYATSGSARVALLDILVARANVAAALASNPYAVPHHPAADPRLWGVDHPGRGLATYGTETEARSEANASGGQLYRRPFPHAAWRRAN